MHKQKAYAVSSDSQERILDTEPRKLNQYLGACSACLSAFSVGNILAWTSPAIPLLEEGEYGFTVSKAQASWIGGLMPIGAAVACVPAGYVTDRLGRKKAMLGLVPVFCLGWALIIWANGMLYIGRFISGMCGGAVCVTAPAFTAEICQKEIRGALCSYYQLLLAGGIMSCYILGSVLNVFWLSIVCAAFPILFGLTFLFFPDTPVFYLTQGRPEDARNALRFFRGPHCDIEPELAELAEASDRGVSDLDAPAWRVYTSKQAVRSLTMSVGMMVFQQLSGVNAIIFYTTDIFKAAGSSLQPAYSTIIIGFMEVFATFLMTFVVDRLGRRVLLVFSSLVMAVCCVVMGVYFNLKTNQDVTQIGWLPLLALCLFIVVFSIGYGPVPWAMMPEILPARIKGTAGAFACVVNWLCAFLVTKFFVDLVDKFGPDVTFWIFAGISAFGVAFSRFALLETKGKSFEEIQRELGDRDPPGDDARF